MNVNSRNCIKVNPISDQEFNKGLYYVSCRSLPFSHIVPINPGLHVQVFGFVQSPFLQAGLHIAEMRMESFVRMFNDITYYYFKTIT